MWPFKSNWMDRPHREALEGNIVYLSRNTRNLVDLLRHLEVAEVLNLYELAVVRKGRNNSEKCYRLYESVVRKDNEAFRSLVRALMKSGNLDLANVLWRHEFGSLAELEVRTTSSAVLRPEEYAVRPRGTTGDQSVSSILMALIVLTFSASFPLVLFLYLLNATVQKILYHN